MSLPQTEQTETIETPSAKNAGNENFPVGSFLIRPDLRRHVHAYYIFARAADDIGDNPLLDSAEKIRRLSRMEQALLDASDDSVPSVIPLRHSLAETGITPAHSIDLLSAFKQDAVKRRYETWDELLGYCRYSANPVGRHVLALHGIGDSTWAANDALCTALQIINHLQDCADDYRELDRVYLPMDMMQAAGTSPADLSHARSTPGLRQVQMDMLRRMEPIMDLAATFPPMVTDFRLRLETSVIYSLAEKMVDRLKSCDPLAENAKLGKWSAIGASLSGVLRGLF